MFHAPLRGLRVLQNAINTITLLLMPDYGKWRVQKKLGTGGQGEVFLVKTKKGNVEAHAQELFRLIQRINHGGDEEAALRMYDLIVAIGDEKQSEVFGALKLLHAPQDSTASKKALERMTFELNAIRAVKHPALIALLDSNLDERWFVTEYFARGTAVATLAESKGDVEKSLRRIRPVVEAVSLLHKKNLIHRDIKPENIFVHDDGSFVLGDCGLTIDFKGGYERVTDVYENVGTRAWMPPWAMEVRHEDVNPSFDVFSLGKVLWAMIVGKPRLPLWYHEKPEFDPAKLFSDSADMHWIKLLLSHSIVENEKSCLEDAGRLLAEIDKTLERIRVGSQALPNRSRPCLICGLGFYELLWDEPTDSRMDMLVRESRSFHCSNCGHVQIFHIPKQRPAWKA